MGKAPADQFYWNDWLSDVELQQASACTKGVWINMLCRMWYSNPRGELHGTRESLAKLCICTFEEFDLFLKEAQALLFCSVTFSVMSRNPNQIITLRNRRMFRQEKDRELNRLRQERFRDKQKNNARITPPSSPSPSSSSSIKDKRKNIKKEKLVKHEKREFVSLTNEEYQKLIDKFGKEKAEQMLDVLDNAKGAKGYKYKSDYRAILSWVVAKVEKEDITQVKNFHDVIDKWEPKNDK